MAIKINNVLTRKKEVFEPVEEGVVRMYICGVTVYGRCHVGHLRCYLSFDAIIRYLKYRGYDVTYVRNFTDIDDKIINRAKEITQGPEGSWRSLPAYESYDACQWSERLAEDEKILQRAKGQDRHLAEVVADHFIDVFRDEDFAPFELIPAQVEPRVSQHIPQVIALIESIIEKGFGYEVGGDVYFDVPAYHAASASYGKLSGRDYTQLVEGARVAPTDKKRFGADFALWKKSGEGEPAWSSPWGQGRPGWHIECSAMSLDKLGAPFDIHGGGKDLIFPHHENEIAQSEAGTEKKFCNYWMHNGFVTVDGVKMSKSLGNFISIKDALGIAPPEVWRLLVLSTHYAHPIDFSRTKAAQTASVACETVRGNIDIAYDRLEYFYETLRRADEIVAGEEVGEEAACMEEPRALELLGRFTEAMDDDFNTAKALAVLGDGMKLVNELCDLKAKQVKKLPGGRPSWIATLAKLTCDLREGFGALGLLRCDPAGALTACREFAARCSCVDVSAVEAKIAERERAREEKDWARSDALRDELVAMGIELRDSSTGTDWRVIR